MSAVQGKIALITGAASGLGLRIAKEFLRNGLKGATLIDVNSDSGIKVVDEITKEFGAGKVIFKQADVCNRKQFEDAFKETVEHFKQLDIVINTAGILNDAVWEKEIEINCRGLVYGTLLAVEEYLPKYKSGEGTVVNFSSIAGLDAFACTPVYCGTKYFVIGFSRSIGDEVHYNRTNVRVLTVCPGATATPLVANISGRNLGPPYEAALQSTLKEIVLQSPEQFVKELMTVLDKGKSGSVWLIENGPATEVEFKTRLESLKK